MKYPLIRSTLEGIFSASVGLSEAEAARQLARDLSHAPFREGLVRELDQAAMDKAFSWKSILEVCDVSYVDTEAEANRIARALLGNVFRTTGGAMPNRSVNADALAPPPLRGSRALRAGYLQR